MIDEMDRRILSLLQQDARLPNAEIARRVGMAPSATLERLRKLEERGVIQGYECRLDARKHVTEPAGDPARSHALRNRLRTRTGADRPAIPGWQSK